MKYSYWEDTGKQQRFYNVLRGLIPKEGEIAHNPALERLRVASNCYYDFYNNGLCNMATEFRRIFGFGITVLRGEMKGGKHAQQLEKAMDTIILEALAEQFDQICQLTPE